MERRDPPERTPEQRVVRWWIAAVCVWLIAIAWSVYLVWSELSGDGGTFSVIVRAMGSVGILYALFLVMRPRKQGMLGPLSAVGSEIATNLDDAETEPSSSTARWAIITITIALAIGAFLYRLTIDSYIHQSAAFFIGVPAVLAITLALTPKAKSATGMIVKGLTLALLLSGVVFFEGFICIVMAAPLFYVVGIAVGVPIDRARRRKKGEGKVLSVVGGLLLILSFEGASPITTLPTNETVSVTREVDASAREVGAALASPPSFDGELPIYLRLGFPRPIDGRGTGLAVGDRRVIVFGDESPMEPMGSAHIHHAGQSGGVVEFRISSSRPGRVVFSAVRDETAFTHWVAWKRSVVEWDAIDADTTAVTWTMSFERKLSPSWYFRPWQRYAATKATGYLIDTVATP